MMSSSVLGRRRCYRQLTTRTGAISTSQLCGVSSRNESIQQYATAGRNLASHMHTTNKFSQRLPAQPIITQALFSSNASQVTIIDDKNNDIFQTTEDTHTVTALPTLISDLDKASQFNQGKGGIPNGLNGWSRRRWNTDFVKETVDRYEYYLKYFYHQQQSQSESNEDLGLSEEMKNLFFSPETTQHAFIAVLRCRLPTHDLSRKIREWERYIGSVGMTQMTDDLSLSMLEANGKAGNVGRAIQLLSLRKSRDYPPKTSEFIYAITAIDAASLYLRKNRNTFLAEKDQPRIDDPTRWLDAILLNMNQRNVALTTPMANRMLNIFARTGRSAKMTHYFYRVRRKPIHDDDVVVEEEENAAGEDSHDDENYKIATYQNRPIRVTIDMRPPPPYHKIPSQVRGKLVHKPGSDIKQLKIERESDPDWSPVLTSAISFADSLKQGACGHDPIELDLISYSILMKVCVNRGSLWRANGIEPDIIAYNTLLIGLSKVGDVPTMKEYTRQLLSNGIDPNKKTIEAIIDSLLNLGDVGAAITICQDYFNQYSALPPYTTHLKILEITLGRGLVFEAKRHVSFIQQLMKWERNNYHTEEFCRVVELTQKNPNLSKEALQHMFSYFGYKLEDSDFF
jgi:pentatricopeptide repeat protein